MYLLEEIKNKKIIDNGSPDFITKEEVKWLMKQAEMVETLLNEVKHYENLYNNLVIKHKELKVNQ